MQGPISDDIAVVGVAYKLPQDVEDDVGFWNVLQGARNLSGRWPEERMNADAHPHLQSRNDKSHSPGGHFIRQDPAGFDAPLFSLTAKEAAGMDPVQRWTLEVSYRAFENAGIPLEALKGSRTAVLSATFTEDYMRMAAMDPDNVERTAATGCLASVIPNRVSYFFGMHGPSIHVDTACSSGLSAFDMACKVLSSGDAETALVTAANLILEPGMYQMFRNLQMLSPDNTCKAFDYKANGFGRGEGVLAFVLKPVSRALRDGDMIRAVVRAVASNQDGHTPALSQPNPVAQEQLIRHVYGRAGLSLDKTRYVEAHGTGTPVGDPIEMKAIGNAFRDGRTPTEPLYVGSVKSNIGHLEGASGLAGILKTILILEKGIIPPNALFEKLNPAIDAELLRVEVLKRCIPWPSAGLRRASVNGFGFGGSNTHVVLDDARHFLEERGLVGHHCTDVVAPAVNGHHVNGSAVNGHAPNGNGVNGHQNEMNGHSNGVDSHATNGNGIDGHSDGQSNSIDGDTCAERHKLLVFSAFDENATQRTLQQYSKWFQANDVSSQAKLDALAHTLAARRSHMRWRTFAIASPSSQSLTSHTKPTVVVSEPAMAWVFTGQGAQYVEMGWGLVDAYPVFKNTLQRVDEVYKSLGCSWSLFDELRQEENINKPTYSQPLSTAVQLGLVELLRSFGLFPKAVVGHSSGEIAAAYAIGALSLESACRVSYFRGLLAGRVHGGSMISINLAPDQVPDFLSKTAPEVSIACINSPYNVTLSGPEAGIDAIQAQADRENIFARKLNTGVAYHSAAMHSVSQEYLDLMGSDLSSAESFADIPMLSTVTGKRINPADLATGQYWVDNMVSPVKFAQGVRLTTEFGITDMIEVGPHPALRRYVQDSLGTDNKTQYWSTLYRGHSAFEKTLELAGTLFSRGHSISLAAVNNEDAVKSSAFLVDCPPYPFDHSRKFWAESRISRDYRLREPTKGGDLLGQRASDWNPLQPRWRNFLSVETSPWIGDHVVGDTVLYPAAAMLIMAIEATREVSSTDHMPTGYFVKEARFLSPIIVPEQWDDRVETMLSLTPMKRHPGWSDITISVYNKETYSWTEVFQASVQTQYTSETDLATVNQTIQKQHHEAQKACVLPVDSQLLYSNAADQGLQYGDWFRLCQDIRWDKVSARAVATVSNADKFHTPSLVHPAVLDTMFHALRVSAGQQHAANVPLVLEDAWFAASGWQSPSSSKVSWLATSAGKSRFGEHGSVSALSDGGDVLLRIEKLVTAAIAKNDGDTDKDQKKLLYGVEWKPQLSLLSPEQLIQACDADIIPRDEAVMLKDHRRRTQVLNMVAVRRVAGTTEEQRTKLNSTLRHHTDWLEHHIKSLSAEERDAAAALTDAEFEAQLDSFAEAFPSWSLYPHVARSLPDIVAGEVDPLQVIFDSDHAKAFYASLFHDVCGDGRLEKFLDLAAHETPALRILEVGAGTGGMTVHILNALKARETRTGAMAFTEYMYTDISPVFFETAKARWEAEGFGGRMAFKTLDMEHAIADQGFKEGSYDLIIAGSCVHATGLLERTLKNLRPALRPGGKFVLLEVTDPTDIATCFFATLASGWWLSQEEWRVKNKSPLVSEDMWDQVLKENGFSGNDLVLRDTKESEAHIVSVIVTTAVETPQEESAVESVVHPRRVYVIDPQQDGQKELAAILANSNEGSVVLTLDNIDSTSISTDDTVVSLIEVDQPILASIPEAQFSQLQNLIKQVANLVWVTAPRDGGSDTQLPHYSIAQGFLRTIRAEIPHARIVSLSIEDVLEKDTRAGYINTTVKTAFGPSAKPDLEYVVRAGLMHTSRAVEDVSGNTTLNSMLSPSLHELAWKDGPAVKLAPGTVGSLGSLRFEQDDAYNTELGPNEIEVEARAWGLSQQDVLFASGRLGPGHDPQDLGSDCAGVVTRVGPNCDPRGPKSGDHVVMLSRGCMRKFPRSHESRVLKIHEGMSFADAAAGLEPALTAYYALLHVARLAEGDTILIHEAASARGQAAVQVAQMQGAEVFVTLTADPKEGQEQEERQFLVDTLGVAPDHIFSLGSFAAGIQQATEKYGVDIVLNTLVGDQRLVSLKLLAPSGRFVDIGLGSVEDLSMAGSLAKNASFATVDVLELRPQLTKKLLRETMALLGGGIKSPPAPTRVFPATQVANAFKALQSSVEGGEARGRIVITPRPDDVVPQLVLGDGSPESILRLEQDASYLVPGGLGGVGRSILVWLAARGAKHLIIPSRSGASSAAAAQVVSSLRSRGVNVVTPKCDIGNECELANLLFEVKQTMPPIRGIINCAMVLTNAVFVNMSYQQWSGAIAAKVTGSFNLHRHLPPQELDFMIHLASLAGVNGQMASANYAAGCSFQDALARCHPGSISLDVGWMADVGLIAETAAYQRQLRDWGNMQMVEERELLEILGMVCRAGAAKATQQLLVGLMTPADYLTKGKAPPPGLVGRPLLSTFAQPIRRTDEASNKTQSSAAGAPSAAAAVDHAALFREATDDKARARIVSAALAEKLARAMMMSADNVDPDRPLSAYGVDSLMAVELRNWIVREFGAVLGMWEMMNGDRVIKAIAETIVQKSNMVEK